MARSCRSPSSPLFSSSSLLAAPTGSGSLALLLALATSTSVFFQTAHAETIRVDAHAEACFLEDVVENTKMSLTFEVSEGGFLDIDVMVRAASASGAYILACN